MTMLRTRVDEADLLPADREAPMFSIGTDTSGFGPAKSCLNGAGLLWTVNKVPLRNPLTNEVVPGFYCVTRQDNKQVVGVVEGQYECVQNEQFFCDVADLFVGDGAQIRRCAYVHKVIEEIDKHGEVIKSTPAEVGGMIYMHLVWDIKRTAINVVGDIVGRCATIRNSHDGKTAALIRLWLLRLACVNGVVLPMPGLSFDFRISHTQSANKRIKEAQAVLEQAPHYYNIAGRALNLLAKEKVNEKLAKRLALLTVDPAHVDNPSKLANVDAKRIDAILERFMGDQPKGNSEAMKGTGYGYLMAVSDLADHAVRIKKSVGFNTRQQRFKSAFSGVGHNLKLAAWDALISELDLQSRLKKIAESN